MDGKLWIKPSSTFIALKLVDIVSTSGNPFNENHDNYDEYEINQECVDSPNDETDKPDEQEQKFITIDELEYLENGLDINNNYADFAKLKIIADANYCLLKKIIPICIDENINVEFGSGILITFPTELLNSSVIHLNRTEVYFVEDGQIYKK